MSRTSNSCNVYSLACGICGLLRVSQIYNYIVKVTRERQAFLFPVAFPRNGSSFGRGLWPTKEESSTPGRESKLSVAVESLLNWLVSKCRDRWMDGRLCYCYWEASESICLPGRVYYSLSGLQRVITLCSFDQWQETKVHSLCSGTLPRRAGPRPDGTWVWKQVGNAAGSATCLPVSVRPNSA